MCFVDVSGNKKSIFSLGKSHRQFIAHLVCFFRCNLSRLERLSYLISNNIVLLLSPGDVLILTLSKQELFISRFGITFIRADELAIIGLCRILRIVRAISKTLS